MNSELKNRSSTYGLGGHFKRTLNSTVTASFPFGSDEYWMEQALLISMNAVGWSAPNPAVGCVVVKNEKCIASGFTQSYGHEHAERMAFQNLGDLDSFTDLKVYVTLEPCSHFGSQPPCVNLLLHPAVAEIFIACGDPDSRVNGEGIRQLREAGKKVKLGILEKEALAWHFPFIQHRKKQRPVWVGKWAETADGYMADALGESKWITGKKSRAYTHWLRQKYDVILVGANTWIQDRPELTVRDCAEPKRRDPMRLIFDPSGRLFLPKFAEALTRLDSTTRVYVAEDRIPKGVAHPSLVVIPVEREAKSLMLEFRQAVEKTPFLRPLQSVFCEGGAGLLTLLIQSEILEAVHLFTGKKKWPVNDERYRVRFDPQLGWRMEAQHYFDDDCLHEWVKS